MVNASQENAPIVILSGVSPLKDKGLGALQEINQVDMIKSSVKWSATCYDIKRIPEYLSTAFRQAVSGWPGPVFLELPPDILNVAAEETDINWPLRGGIAVKPGPDTSKNPAFRLP